MGLFSGSFGTGLVTGLATSVDKSLNDAMDKRDEELSAARRFWQTRQAQKLDLAEAEDARSEKALNRMINEANGDVALGFAAYQAAGGDADSVEKFIARMDSTRAAKGEFSLTDALVLPEGFKAPDVTREQAFGAIRTPIKGVSAEAIDIDDPLANIGLGLRGGAANKVADKINNMIPPQEVTRVEGFEGVQLDMSKMLEAEEYARSIQEFDKAMGDSNWRERTVRLSDEIASLNPENFESTDEYNTAKAKLEAELDASLQIIARIARAEDASGNTGASTTLLNGSWTQRKSQALIEAGITGSIKDNTASYFVTDPDGQQRRVFASESPEALEGFIAASNAAVQGEAERWVKNFQQSDGSFTQNTLDVIQTNQALDKAYQSLTGEPVTEEETVAEVSEGPDWTKVDVVKDNPQGFADSQFTRNPNVNTEVLYNTLIRAGVSEEDAVRISEGIYAKQQAAAEAAASQPKYIPGKGLVYPGEEGHPSTVVKQDTVTETDPMSTWADYNP